MKDHNDQKHLPGAGSFSWNDSYSGELTDYTEPDPDLLEIVEGLPPGRALDIGCGAGGLVIALAKSGWNVTGVDIADKAISAARKAAENHQVEAEFHVADATTWKPASSYELVTSSFALPDKKGRASIYQLIREILAPGGMVVLKEFDSGMQHLFAQCDLTVGEQVAAFDGFEIIRAEVVDTPVHEHAGAAKSGEPWTAALFCARKVSHL